MSSVRLSLSTPSSLLDRHCDSVSGPHDYSTTLTHEIACDSNQNGNIYYMINHALLLLPCTASSAMVDMKGFSIRCLNLEPRSTHSIIT